MRSRLLLPSLAACALLAGCGRGSGISFDQYVNATVELRKLSTRAPTPAGFAAGKRELEARLRVTDADLERYAGDHANDVTLMSAAWDSIEARLGRATEADSASRRGVPLLPGTRTHGAPALGATATIPAASTPAPPTTSTAAAHAPAPPRR